MRPSWCVIAGLTLLRSLVAADPARGEGPPDAEVQAALDAARSSLIQGHYDESIQGLSPILERLRNEPDPGSDLRDVYLLLIKTYVTAGNYHRLRPQGSVTAELHHDRARELTEECLLTEGMSHTRPVPVWDYPEEMIRMFELVRSEKLGSLRVIKLEPPDAMVILDGRTIKAPGPGPAPEIVDIVAGSYDLVIRAEGYQDRTELVRIEPGATLEREYALEKGRGVRWWATRVVGASIVFGAGAVAALGDDGSQPQPLPAPPDPPE